MKSFVQRIDHVHRTKSMKTKSGHNCRRGKDPIHQPCVKRYDSSWFVGGQKMRLGSHLSGVFTWSWSMMSAHTHTPNPTQVCGRCYMWDSSQDHWWAAWINSSLPELTHWPCRLGVQGKKLIFDRCRLSNWTLYRYTNDVRWHILINIERKLFRS